MSDTKHPSHVTRASDASTYDTICVNCGAHDQTPGGWGDLAKPCSKVPAGSIYETLYKRLFAHGLFEEQAHGIMATVVANSDPVMEDRWCEQANAYPAGLILVLWASARRATLEWMDANFPEHWARQFFVPGASP